MAAGADQMEEEDEMGGRRLRVSVAEDFISIRQVAAKAKCTNISTWPKKDNCAHWVFRNVKRDVMDDDNLLEVGMKQNA